MTIFSFAKTSCVALCSVRSISARFAFSLSSDAAHDSPVDATFGADDVPFTRG